MRSYSVTGVVIKRTPISEADRIITIFTRDHGKITTLAKGVRKITSRRSGSIELFNEIKATLHGSASHLPILGEVEIIDSFSNWRKHLGRITLAYQLAEAIDKLTPENENHPKIYYQLISYLTQISDLDSNWKQTTDLWLVELIQELGYFPKDQVFSGNVYEFVETISSRPFYSPSLLKRLSRKV